MRPNTVEDRALAEQTQEWMQRADAEPESFAAWLERSPQHVQSYLQMMAIEREFFGIDSQHEIDVDALIAKIQSNVVPLTPRPLTLSLSHKGRGGLLMRFAAGLAAVVVGIAVWMLIARSGTENYRTDTGQQQKIKLADGSIVELNTESRIRTRFTEAGRDVYLLAGEALFDVRHDGHRPFRVHVAGMIIRDIGTQFNVYRHSAGTTVSVLEGEVEIVKENAGALSTRLTAGEAASIGPAMQTMKRAKADVVRATAWRQRRLWFQGDTLGEIAEEFNRYNAAPKILVDDAALRSRRFSGVFNADDPKSFVQFLYQDAGIDFDYDERGLVIRAR